MTSLRQIGEDDLDHGILLVLRVVEVHELALEDLALVVVDQEEAFHWFAASGSSIHTTSKAPTTTWAPCGARGLVRDPSFGPPGARHGQLTSWKSRNRGSIS